MAKQKIKPILPSLREKKRYVVFEVISDSSLDGSSVSENIMQSSLDFMGELGVGNAGIMILNDKWDNKTQKGIVKVHHKYVNHLKSSLMLIENIDGHKAIIRGIGVSGILKKAIHKYAAA